MPRRDPAPVEVDVAIDALPPGVAGALASPVAAAEAWRVLEVLAGRIRG